MPDQLADNNELRKRHATLTEFAERTMRTRLDFAPGARYQYSSMGILLAARLGELLSGSDIKLGKNKALPKPPTPQTRRDP